MKCTCSSAPSHLRRRPCPLPPRRSTGRSISGEEDLAPSHPAAVLLPPVAGEVDPEAGTQGSREGEWIFGFCMGGSLLASLDTASMISRCIATTPRIIWCRAFRCCSLTELSLQTLKTNLENEESVNPLFYYCHAPRDEFDHTDSVVVWLGVIEARLCIDGVSVGHTVVDGV